MYSRFSTFPSAFLLTILIVGGTEVHAQDERTGEAAPSYTDEHVRKHVANLVAAGFADRQQATAELLKLEADAIPLLNSILTTATGETASRLRQIVGQLQKQRLDDRIDAFNADPCTRTASELPQWERFSALVGTDNDALTIFREVLTAEHDLFATRLFNPRELPAVLESRSAEFARVCHGREDEEFPIASCMALMILGSEPDTRLIRATSANISDALDDPRFSRLIADGVHAQTVKAVTSEWLKRPGISADRPLLFSIRHQLPVGRSIAIRIIESQSRRQDMYFSLLCLARLNNPDDLPLVESLLETPTVLWPPRGQTVEPPRPDFTVQTRDVALAVAISLRGANPDDFGIPVKASEVTVFVVDSLGFDNDTERIEALAKYRSKFGTVAAAPEN